MSKREPKIRVVVAQAGHDRELFSMREGAKGDVYIFLKPTEQIRFGGHEGELKEERFSVHPSPQTEGYTITCRITFADGNTADGYTHARPDAGGFCWPLTARTCPRLNFDHHISKPGADDTIIRVETFDIEQWVLGWMLLVCDVDTDITPYLAKSSLNKVSIRFDHFTIWLVYGYLQMPTDLVGATLLGVTHPPRLNGEDVEPPEEMSGTSPSPEDAFEVLGYMMGRLGSAHVDQVEREHGYTSRREIIDHLRERSTRWWRAPRAR